jgi:hypothetical protein
MQIEKIKSVKNIWNPKLSLWGKIYWSIWRIYNKAYYSVYYTFYPQHKSIRKAIPNSWADLDSIVEDVLTAIIISFVEEEKGLDQLEMIINSMSKDDEHIIKEWGSVDAFWDYYNNCYGDYNRLQSIYTWVTVGKKGMQNYLESIAETNNWDEYSKVEKTIHDKDSEYLADLVRLRKYLWT